MRTRSRCPSVGARRSMRDEGGEMPRTVWIERDGAREARSELLTAYVLDGGLQRVKR